MKNIKTTSKCGRIMVGCGEDWYDPLCELPKDHKGVCLSTAALANYHISKEDLDKMYGKKDK